MSSNDNFDEKLKLLQEEINQLKWQFERLWERDTVVQTQMAQMAQEKEARQRIQKRESEPPEGTDDWKSLNDGITNLVFRSSWPEDDWV
jgi:TolA-binding protein